MINLAGKDPLEVDKVIRDELERAEIEAIPTIRSTGEVPYSFKGTIIDGHISLTRAWYYWIAVGKIPIEVAWRIYNHPEGKATVRIGGHCGCMSPDSYGINKFDKATGQQIVSRAQYDSAVESLGQGGKNKEFMEDFTKKFVIDSGQPKVEYATCYHIDDQAGLLLFSMYIKKHFIANLTKETNEWLEGKQ